MGLCGSKDSLGGSTNDDQNGKTNQAELDAAALVVLLAKIASGEEVEVGVKVDSNTAVHGGGRVLEPVRGADVLVNKVGWDTYGC